MVLLFGIIVGILVLLSSSCTAYAMHLGGTWHGFELVLTCREKVPLKYPIPVNTSLYSTCILIVSLLTTPSASVPGLAIK